VYRDLGLGDYIAGTIRRRDGFVRRTYRGNPDGAGPEVIGVEVETAGSGRYSHAEMFVFDAVARTVRSRDPEVTSRGSMPAVDAPRRPGMAAAPWH